MDHVFSQGSGQMFGSESLLSWEEGRWMGSESQVKLLEEEKNTSRVRGSSPAQLKSDLTMSPMA